MTGNNYLTGGKFNKWSDKVGGLIKVLVENSENEQTEFCIVEIGNSMTSPKSEMFFEMIEKLGKSFKFVLWN
jgi:hypothetical protein